MKKTIAALALFAFAAAAASAFAQAAKKPESPAAKKNARAELEMKKPAGAPEQKSQRSIRETKGGKPKARAQ